jgi:hypothetical protein
MIKQINQIKRNFIDIVNNNIYNRIIISCVAILLSIEMFPLVFVSPVFGLINLTITLAFMNMLSKNIAIVFSFLILYIQSYVVLCFVIIKLIEGDLSSSTLKIILICISINISFRIFYCSFLMFISIKIYFISYHFLIKSREVTNIFNQVECCVCMEEFKEEIKNEFVTLYCDHIIHEKCLEELVKSKIFSCPICRYTEMI